jgi:hypothetical protein
MIGVSPHFCSYEFFFIIVSKAEFPMVCRLTCTLNGGFHVSFILPLFLLGHREFLCIKGLFGALHSQNSHSTPSTPLHYTSYNELCLGHNFVPLHLFHHHKKKEDMNTVTPAFLAPNKSPNKSRVFSKLSS